MASLFCSLFSYIARKRDHLILALCWALGLFFGFCLFRSCGSNLASQMPLAMNCQSSIFQLLTPILLPFLISAFAVYISLPRLLFGVCFLKALLFCYVSCAVNAAYGSAGWLIRGLFLFTDLSGTVLLYHYWHRHITGTRKFSFGSFGAYQTAVLLFAWVDYRYIAPLLRLCIFERKG